MKQKILFVVDVIIGIFVKILIAIALLAAMAFVVSYLSIWIWPEAWGSYSLGNDIYMVEWDEKGRYIVLSDDLEGNVCEGGWPLIPDEIFDNEGNFKELVIDAKSDESWIIARTKIFGSNNRNFYIFSKKFNSSDLLEKLHKGVTDSLSLFEFEKQINVLKSTNLCQYTDSNLFITECNLRNIDLRFE